MSVCVSAHTHLTHTRRYSKTKRFFANPRLTAYPITAAETLVMRESTLKLPDVIQCGPRDMYKIDSVISDWAPSRDYSQQDTALSEPWAVCQTRKVNIVQCPGLFACTAEISRKSLSKAE